MKDPIQQVADLLKVIAHPDRLKVIKLLSEQGPLNGTSLLTQLNIEQPLMSKYLTKMRNTGILISKRKGKEILYNLSNPAIAVVLKILLDQSSSAKV